MPRQVIRQAEPQQQQDPEQADQKRIDRMRYTVLAKKSHTSGLRHCGHRLIFSGYGASSPK